MSKLEDEAKAFTKKKSPKRTLKDTTSLRFYMGQALAGLLARGPTNRPEEVVREAYNYALLSVQFEKDNF